MADGTPVGTAFLNVVPQLGAGFQSAIGGALTSALGPVAAVAGGVLAAGLAAGFAVFKIGETFDEAFDQIRIQTGATGDELAGLSEDFKAVFSAVPTDAGLAADAIAGLAQRLDISGQPLQDLSVQILELSRITETDLEANIESVTRTFGDWGIAVADQAGTLDQLFRASQETGIGVDALAGSLVQFGAPLRQLGFDFETSAALISQFEKEGVNAELVLGSLRIALGRMAREGEPAQETLARVVEEIANAGSASEANALALELFGARAGPDMAAAIREGRFEVAALVDTIANGQDTIVGAGKDTQDFAEKWEMFKNRVLVALEPIATRVFTAIGNLIDVIGPKVEQWINGVLIPAIDRFAIWWDENGARIMDAAGAVFGAIGNVIGTVVGAIQNLIGVFKSGEGELGSTMSSIQGIIGGAFDIIKALVDWFKAFWAEFGDEIMAVITNAFEVIGGIISGVVQVIEGVINIIAGVFTGDWKRAWEGVKGIFSGIWEAIKSILEGALNNLLTFFGDFIEDSIENIGDWIDDVVTFFKELPGKVLDALKALPGQMIEFGKALVAGIITGLGNLASQVFESIKSGISSAIKNAQEFFGMSLVSDYTMKHLGMPLARGVLVGYAEALDGGQLLAITEKAVGTITAAALPSMASPSSPSTSSESSSGFAPAAVQPTNVIFSFDPEGKEKLAEFVVDWGSRRIRQVTRAGG